MFKLKKTTIAVICTLFFQATALLAQTGSSPYTALGIGQLTHRGTTRNVGMGGMGVSAASSIYGNLLNPALLTYNSLTVFETSYIGEQKTLSTNVQSQESFNANIEYMSLIFPVSKRWKTGIGLQPISKVNYNAKTVQKVENAPKFYENVLTGSGGLSRLYWANAFLVGKGFSVGLQLNYNFGKISRESRLVLANEYYVTGLFVSENYSQFTLQPGIHYSYNLGNDRSINFGATVTFATDYNTTYFQSLERRTITDTVIAADTLAYDENGVVTIPTTFTAGISYEKLGRYTVGIDITRENWSGYNNALRKEDLSDVTKISVGGEITPDYASISNYLKRITYRAGFSYEKLPWEPNGSTLDSYNITTGFSLPLNRGFSSLNLAFVYGVVNTDITGLIEEEYYRFHLGLTINDRWFVKRKVN